MSVTCFICKKNGTTEKDENGETKIFTNPDGGEKFIKHICDNSKCHKHQQWIGDQLIN